MGRRLEKGAYQAGCHCGQLELIPTGEFWEAVENTYLTVSHLRERELEHSHTCCWLRTFPSSINPLPRPHVYRQTGLWWPEKARKLKD